MPKKRRRLRFLLLALAAIIALPVAAIHAYDAFDDSSAALTLPLPGGRALAYTHSAHPAATRVVLIHGAPANSTSWTKLTRLLENYDVVAVDRLGYGNSSPNAELSLAAHAASIEPLLIPGCIVVGHSYGAPVALRLAADYPDRIAGVVLVAGATDPDMNDTQWLRRTGDAIPGLLPRTWKNANLELLALTDENDAMRPLLERVTCKVAALHGTRDLVCPHDSTTAHLQRELVSAADIRVESIEKAGHNLHLSRTEEIAELIDWIAEPEK